MSSMEKRLEAFRQLPLRAQLSLLNSTRSNSILSQNREYIESLERIHQECLNSATPEQKAAYDRFVST
ncbi:hypothetical protein [Aliterella atlantica]|uniref:Uncharacterized protein n=1 Tax=Aliterella atlantica CENA595 TaxID=1618023 RepID=A0A0D8ZR04_9CYAN|nr:hypothetical protein [Aliterella atlantica]KJH71165.1 hypothetical protein UH38_14245 [Aliterella atlantica CENA595]